MNDLFATVERAKKEWEVTIDAIAEGVALFDAELLTIRRANWTLAKMLNTLPHNLVGANVHTLLCGCQQPACTLEARLRSFHAGTCELTRPGNHHQWTLCYYPISSDDRIAASGVVVIRDMTQERLWQQRILEAEKQAAMTRMAAALVQQIAPSLDYIEQHQFNILKGVTHLREAMVDYRVALQTGESLDARHNIETLLQDIEQTLYQSSRDISHIYASIASIGDLAILTPKMQYSNLNDILADTIKALEKEIGQGVILEQEFENNLPLLQCDQLRLQTAFMNLLLYATRSIQANSQVSVKTQSQDGHVEVLILCHTLPANTVEPLEKAYSKEDQEQGTDQQVWFHLAVRIIQDLDGHVQVERPEASLFRIKVIFPPPGA